MKKIYSVLVGCLLLLGLAYPGLAQQRTVSGNVTGNGEALPGVNVLIKGTATGTVTDNAGNYSITVPDENAILVFSSIGFVSQEISVGNRTSISVGMEVDVTQLSEVVVTALGVERETKSLGYSVTQVGGENFQEARTNNLADQLEGRVAGVNVSKIASGPAGSSRVIIRGNKSLLGNNQPLYVVDGIPMDNSGFGQAGIWGGRDQGDGMASINPDDIESITVLKGANAAALYGARAANGVINIITKKGTASRGLGIDYTSNFVFEKVNDLRDYQTSFGQGNFDRSDPTDPNSERIPYAPRTQTEAYNWGTSSWGPRLGTGTFIGFDGVQRPYVDAGDNWSRFYQTGTSLTNTIALTGGNETQNFRVSVSDLRNSSIVPNSGFNRQNISLATNSKFGEKITFTAKALYSHEYANNRPYLSDSPANGILSMYYIPANMNVDWYRGDENKLGAIPLGTPQSSLDVWGKIPGEEYQQANNNWHQNPWWVAYQFNNDDWRDRLLSSGQIRYDITDWLWVQGRGGMDWYTLRRKDLVPQGTGYQRGGSMNEREYRVRETNVEWMAGFDKTFNQISVNAFVGGNQMRHTYENMNLNGSGFSVPFEQFINNTVSRSWSYGFNEYGINSLYGSAQVGYNNIVFITGTAREDWFSVLNPANNHVLYPSVGASFVFSDAFAMPAFISFGKLRASWAQVGSATIGAYDTNLTYSLNGNTHNGYTIASFSSAMGNNGLIPNPDLKPLTSTETEFGIDIRFLGDRLGMDLTYYNQKTTDDILNATISRASGFGRTSVNVGELQNKGIEVLLRGTPVTGPLTWEVSLNLAKNNNEVVSLIEGNDELIIEEPRSRNAFIKHVVGHPFGVITGRVQELTSSGDPLITFGGFAKDPVTGAVLRDGSGNPIVKADGRPVRAPGYAIIGNGVPDVTGGLLNSFGYKNFNLSFLVDFKFGGDILSGTNMRLTSAGLTKESLKGRAGEEPLIVDGMVEVPVIDINDVEQKDEDGNTITTLVPFTSTYYVSGSDGSGDPVYTQHTGTLTPDQARSWWGAVQGETNSKTDLFLYDAGFIKLRQITLGYNFPRAMLGSTPFRNITLSFVARNVAILHKNTPNIDPESSYQNGNGQGLDYFGFPATRSYGFDLKVQF